MTEEKKGRYFESGAYRDTAMDKPDYAKYLSPEVIRAFGRYMLKHQMQSDGQIREGDNWKKGIPMDAYMSSGYRHFMDWWELHCMGIRANSPGMEEALCALLFNVMGYLHEYLKAGKGQDD